jgi:hypothetical protein
MVCSDLSMLEDFVTFHKLLHFLPRGEMWFSFATGEYCGRIYKIPKS